jgi:hypothetical protein
VDEGEDVLRKLLVVSCVHNATRRPMDLEEGSPIPREKGVAARTEDGILMGRRGMPVMLLLLLLAFAPIGSWG